jgi:hypothetical protein
LPAIPNNWTSYLSSLETRGLSRGGSNLLRKLSLFALCAGGGTATINWADRRPVTLDPSRDAAAIANLHRTTVSKNLDAWFDHWVEAADGSGWIPYLPAWPDVEPGAWWHPFNADAVASMSKWSSPTLQLALALVGTLRAADRFGRPYVTVSVRDLCSRMGRSIATTHAAILDLEAIGQIERGPKRRSITLLSACPLSQIAAFSGECETRTKESETRTKSVQNKNATERNKDALNIVIGENDSVLTDARFARDEMEPPKSRFEQELAAFIQKRQ